MSTGKIEEGGNYFQLLILLLKQVNMVWERKGVLANLKIKGNEHPFICNVSGIANNIFPRPTNQKLRNQHFIYVQRRKEKKQNFPGFHKR